MRLAFSFASSFSLRQSLTLEISPSTAPSRYPNPSSPPSAIIHLRRRVAVASIDTHGNMKKSIGPTSGGHLFLHAYRLHRWVNHGDVVRPRRSIYARIFSSRRNAGYQASAIMRVRAYHAIPNVSVPRARFSHATLPCSFSCLPFPAFFPHPPRFARLFLPRAAPPETVALSPVGEYGTTREGPRG